MVRGQQWDATQDRPRKVIDMSAYEYTVRVECETKAQADQVMAERIGYDEPIYVDADGNHYPDRGGFDYSIDFAS